MLGTFWHRFMFGYDGSLFSGPCSQLMVVLNQIGWIVAPLTFLIMMGSLTTCTLWMALHFEHFFKIYDGWLQHVAQSVAHRASMADLQGLDPHVVNIDKTAMPALDAALVGSLHDTAFIGNSVHSKYDADVTKKTDCPTCGPPDHPAQWLQCPKYQAEREAIAEWSLDSLNELQSFQIHLLPSRSPWAVPRKKPLLEIDSDGTGFFSSPGTGPQHVFTDGTSAGLKPFCLTAWGCINASSAGPVVMFLVSYRPLTDLNYMPYDGSFTIRWI